MDDGYPWRDVSLDYFRETESTSGSHSIVVDWYQRDDKYPHSLSDYYDDDELLDHVVDEVLDCSGPGSYRESLAYLFKSGMISEKAAYLLKSGMLSDISIIQGGDIHRNSNCLPSVSSAALGGDVHHEERKWEICGFASPSAGASGGFYTLPSVSSVALTHLVLGLTGSTQKKVWTPDVSHAIAVTDPYVGSRGTRDCLISILEKNQMPNYFKNAQTEVYFLAGGNYQKHYAPWQLQHKVRKVPSSAASKQFVEGLKNLQPKQRLMGSKDTVYQLQWYYKPEKGLGFHGMWVGEIQHDGNRSFVRCLNNDITKEPYKHKLRNVVLEEVRNLPADLLEEMEMSWTSRPAGETIINYTVSQILKHAVQGEEFLVDDYCFKATEFSRLLTNEKLEEIMERNNFERGKYYESKDLRMAVSNEVMTEARVTYKQHAEYGVVPYGFTILLDYQYSPINHVDLSSEYDHFTFG